ncbi:MAG: membrane protein insertase YidC [Deltaproteobacteria bacterium]|nr:membrane protein insertase YidC [Deltaproteobacteria bacterium]
MGLGWTTLVAVPMLYLLKFFYQLIHNYGVAIILLTILVKILLNPINRKSLASMKGMQAIQPRLKELRQKYGEDKQKLNQETMQLFKNNKINPMGGCLPMLLQIPIYIALYKVLWSSVELYHAPFFWFYKDLSAPDPFFVTPLLLGITMFIQTKMTPTATVDPMQQKMMLMMPLMFCLFMVFLPMGLGLYILVNTLMTILQQWMYKKEIRMRDVVLGRLSLRGR